MTIRTMLIPIPMTTPCRTDGAGRARRCAGSLPRRPGHKRRERRRAAPVWSGAALRARACARRAGAAVSGQKDASSRSISARSVASAMARSAADPRQVVLREELRGRDLALVERLVLGRDASPASFSSATSAPRSSSQAQTTSPSTISRRVVLRPDLVDVAEVAALGGGVGRHQVVDHVADDGVGVLERGGEQLALHLEAAVAGLAGDEAPGSRPPGGPARCPGP